MNNIKKEANLKIKKEIIKTIGCIRRYKSERNAFIKVLCLKRSERNGYKDGNIWRTKYRGIKGQEKDKGYIVAFSFGKGAYEEVAKAKSRGLFIELLTVDKLLEYEEPAGQGKIF